MITSCEERETETPNGGDDEGIARIEMIVPDRSPVCLIKRKAKGRLDNKAPCTHETYSGDDLSTGVRLHLWIMTPNDSNSPTTITTS